MKLSPSSGRLVEIANEVSEERYIPRTVGFSKDGSEIIVGYLESHEL